MKRPGRDSGWQDEGNRRRCALRSGVDKLIVSFGIEGNREQCDLLVRDAGVASNDVLSEDEKMALAAVGYVSVVRHPSADISLAPLRPWRRCASSKYSRYSSIGAPGQMRQ